MSVDFIFVRSGLHDHIDVNSGAGKRHEHLGSDPRRIGDFDKRNLGLVARMGDAGDDILFHVLVPFTKPKFRAFHCPAGLSNVDRTCTGMRQRIASSTERTCKTFAPRTC